MSNQEIGNNISKRIIEYDNVNNLSLKEVFKLFFSEYEDLELDEDIILIQVVSFLSREGYDIVSTHPFKLKRYK